jgi:hypothetical protein
LQGHHDLPFAGHNLTGRELLQGVQTAAAELQLAAVDRTWRHGSLPWWLMRTLSPLVPTWREISEMAYLWHEAHALDDSALRALLANTGQSLASTDAGTALRCALQHQFMLQGPLS